MPSVPPSPSNQTQTDVPSNTTQPGVTPQSVPKPMSQISNQIADNAMYSGDISQNSKPPIQNITSKMKDDNKVYFIGIACALILGIYVIKKKKRKLSLPIKETENECEITMNPFTCEEDFTHYNPMFDESVVYEETEDTFEQTFVDSLDLMEGCVETIDIDYNLQEIETVPLETETNIYV